MELVILWIVFGIAAAFIASSKGGNGCLWFFLGLLLGPIGIILSFFAGGRKCQYCLKHVHPSAVVCPYCQRELDPKDELEDKPVDTKVRESLI